MTYTKSRPRTGGSRRRTNRRPFNSGRGGDRRSTPRGRGNKRAQPTFDPSQFINTQPVDEAPEPTFVPTHKFADFALDSQLKRNVAAAGLETPSPIQDQVIPEILAGKDVIGLAETGTGKTAAFLLPLINGKLHGDANPTLILTPTRELALQIEVELQKLAKGMKLFSTVCVGGTSIRPQIRGLKRRNHFIIGTPGRVKDLIEQRVLKTKFIDSVVLDEADRMLDMGFIHDMRDILGTLPAERHTLFFSATMDDKTAGLVHDFMKDPVTISVKKRDVTNSIKQNVVPFDHDHKFETLSLLLAKPEFKRVIIFGAMKHSVNKLGIQLSENGIPAESIHGNKSHGQRQQALNRFKSGQVRVLVATDVAARGIHVDNVTQVINYDLPNTFADYVHRIGRTGRGTQRGEALTFVPKSAV